MDLISIIVPIYNAEKVIKRCIESISRQSYEMLEIILVDDGSTDQSLEICEDMSEKDSRIKIIHQNNGGVSRARNTGLKKATGQYIMMVDSDDYLYERAVELMLREIKKNKADLAICGFERGMDEAFPFSIDLSLKSSVIDNREALNRIYKNDYCALQYVAPWAKLYARRLFDNIIYPEGKIFEDIYITHHRLYKCGRIAVLPQRMVYYSFCDNSLMNKPFHLGKLDYLEALEERIYFFKDCGFDELEDVAYDEYLHSLIWEYSRTRDILHDKNAMNKISDCFKKIYKVGHASKRYPQETVWYLKTFAINPEIIVLYWKINSVFEKIWRKKNEN